MKYEWRGWRYDRNTRRHDPNQYVTSTPSSGHAFANTYYGAKDLEINDVCLCCEERWRHEHGKIFLL